MWHNNGEYDERRARTWCPALAALIILWTHCDQCVDCVDLAVHFVDLGSVVFVDDGTFDFEGIRKLTRFHREGVGEEGEFFDAFVCRKVALAAFDALSYHGAYFGIAYEVVVAAVGYVVFLCIVFEHSKCRNN